MSCIKNNFNYLILIQAIAAIAMGILVGYGTNKGNPELLPLVGINMHDFGITKIQGAEGVELNHKFTLVNQSASMVTINNITSTCGCTTAKASSHNIAPNEKVDIEVSITMARSGTRVEKVFLHIEEWGVQELLIRVVGRQTREVIVNPSVITLNGTSEKQISVFTIKYDSDKKPPALTFVGNSAFLINSDDWELVFPRDPRIGQPARWVCKISLSIEKFEFLSRKEVIAVMSDNQRDAEIQVFLESGI